MDNLLTFWEEPAAEETIMLAGWRQWADAGNISSGLPEYLIQHIEARKIGQLKPGGFYLFQVPGTHHLLRPEVNLTDGRIQSLEDWRNDFYYSDSSGKGLVIFLGEEPHLAIDRYAEAWFDAVEHLQIRRIIALGGVYGALPYNRDREVSAVCSSSALQEELDDYAVRLSDYQGGATIGTVLVHEAEKRNLEMIDFYAFAPAYDFSQLSELIQGIRIDNDYRAWYEMMRRVNHMMGLQIDLSELEQLSEELMESMDAKIAELDRQMPQFQVKEYMERLERDFAEKPFLPLDDMWEQALGDLLDDL
jgi:proteasome assembly chaperone (PAC2) family protein